MSSGIRVDFGKALMRSIGEEDSGCEFANKESRAAADLPVGRAARIESLLPKISGGLPVVERRGSDTYASDRGAGKGSLD